MQRDQTELSIDGLDRPGTVVRHGHLGDRTMPLGHPVQPAAQPLRGDAEPAPATGGGTRSGHRASMAARGPPHDRPHRTPAGDARRWCDHQTYG